MQLLIIFARFKHSDMNELTFNDSNRRQQRKCETVVVKLEGKRGFRKGLEKRKS